MATNTQTQASLVASTVPSDRNCPQNGQEMLNLVQDFMQVNLTDAVQQGSGSDSIAQQALQLAQTALSAAQGADARIPQRRTGGAPQTVPAGDGQMPITWSPPMPSDNYDVHVTYYGPNVAVANTQIYNYRVINDTRTVNGCTLRLDNTPANTSVVWVVTDLGA